MVKTCLKRLLAYATCIKEDNNNVRSIKNLFLLWVDTNIE